MENLAVYLLVIACAGLPLWIIGLVLGSQAARAWWQVMRSADWPRVEGRVLASGLVQGRSAADASHLQSAVHLQRVHYEYTVAGRRHVGHRIAFGQPLGFGAASMARVGLARYAPGASVTVHHHPADPTRAVLERRAHGAGLRMALALLMGFIHLGLVVGLGALMLDLEALIEALLSLAR